MKKLIKIKTSNSSYNVIIEKKSIIKNILIAKKNHNKIFVIIDSKLNPLIKSVKNIKNIHIIKIKASEKIKSIDSYYKISLNLLKLQIDRSSCIIAIGGGTVGDLVGFISGTILRGVKFILIPTTLLSQVDSSLGGKNGINTSYGKNLIGTFFNPCKVIIDPFILKSLSKKQIKSGYAEILKHALIRKSYFYSWLKKNYQKVLSLEDQFISKAIMESIKIKAYFIQKDEKEALTNSNSRAMLNFGHTFGHALEAMNSYNNNLSHGEAISIGMSLASKISYKLNHLSKNEYDELILHLKKVKLPYYDERVKNNKIYNLMHSDKKNTNNKINLILLKRIGKAYFKRGLNKEAIKELLS
tara:strand:+ start:209 stop:1276 length:1068 start_codon:yes stop_codon:yes gene_type:complete